MVLALKSYGFQDQGRNFALTKIYFNSSFSWRCISQRKRTIGDCLSASYIQCGCCFRKLSIVLVNSWKFMSILVDSCWFLSILVDTFALNACGQKLLQNVVAHFFWHLQSKNWSTINVWISCVIQLWFYIVNYEAK